MCGFGVLRRSIRSIVTGALGISIVALAACTTTKQYSAAGFLPPEGDYRLIVMRPDVTASVLTAGGVSEPREDWTEKARANVITALQEQQAKRGGRAVVTTTVREAGAEPRIVTQLDRLHEAVGRSIQLHKYTPYHELPTKKDKFDWTLGELAVDYGNSSGYDYALFLYAEDSFSSGGRVALQAVSMLGCVVGVCLVPPGGHQIAFASLVDLKTGNVVWYNHLFSEVGDIRDPDGANALVENLLADMKPAKPQKRS